MDGRRIRVLQVVDSLDGGGAERHVVDLAVELARRGHAVRVACSVPGPLLGYLLRQGIQIKALTPRLVKRRASPVYAAALRRVVQTSGVDLVHAHIYASEFAGAVATAGTAIPLVVTEHSEGRWRGPAARAVSRWVYGRATRIIAASNPIRRLLVTAYGVPEARIACILPAPGPKPERPVGDRPAVPGPVVGAVSRLQPEKGMDVFLRAAAAVRQVLPTARFVVVGDGPLRGSLERLARRLGVAGSVEFLGYRPDARALLAGFDVVAVPSLTEAAPLVVFEAMGAGVPIVASAVGGIPDQVRDEREGLLVRPGDPRALAEGILRILRNPALAAELRREGAARAAELSHERMVDAVEAIYAQTLPYLPRPGEAVPRRSSIERVR